MAICDACITSFTQVVALAWPGQNDQSVWGQYFYIFYPHRGFVIANPTFFCYPQIRDFVIVCLLLSPLELLLVGCIPEGIILHHKCIMFHCWWPNPAWTISNQNGRMSLVRRFQMKPGNKPWLGSTQPLCMSDIMWFHHFTNYLCRSRLAQLSLSNLNLSLSLLHLSLCNQIPATTFHPFGEGWGNIGTTIFCFVYFLYIHHDSIYKTTKGENILLFFLMIVDVWRNVLK